MAEFCLVLCFMIKSFNSVMSSLASVFFRALLALGILAQLRIVQVIVPPSVFDRVKVDATLMVVSYIFLWTFVSFEILQLEMLDLNFFFGLVVYPGKISKDILFL